MKTADAVGSNPGGAPAGFDPDFYLHLYPDVAASGMDPVSHYQQFGQREGRMINASEYAARDASAVQYGQNNPYGFDASFYLRNNPDVAQALNGRDPLQHYLQYGMGEGRARNAYDAAGGMERSNIAAGVMPAAPDTSSQRLDPSDPASWAAWAQRASNQSQGLNRLPFVAPTSDTLSADPLAVRAMFYPRGNNWSNEFNSGTAAGAAQAGAAGGQTVANLGMQLMPQDLTALNRTVR